MPRLSEVIERVEEMKNDHGFTDFKYEEIKAIGKDAALFLIDDEEEWLPYSQLAELDGTLYATEWIMKKKGLL